MVADKPLYIKHERRYCTESFFDFERMWSYVIEAHFEMTEKANETDNPGKFKDIIMRRLKRGECLSYAIFWMQRISGTILHLCEEENIQTAYDDVQEKDLGFMLYDMDYSDRENIQSYVFQGSNGNMA